MKCPSCGQNGVRFFDALLLRHRGPVSCIRCGAGVYTPLRNRLAVLAVEIALLAVAATVNPWLAIPAIYAVLLLDLAATRWLLPLRNAAKPLRRSAALCGAFKYSKLALFLLVLIVIPATVIVIPLFSPPLAVKDIRLDILEPDVFPADRRVDAIALAARLPALPAADSAALAGAWHPDSLRTDRVRRALAAARPPLDSLAAATWIDTAALARDTTEFYEQWILLGNFTRLRLLMKIARISLVNSLGDRDYGRALRDLSLIAGFNAILGKANAGLASVRIADNALGQTWAVLARAIPAIDDTSFLRAAAAVLGDSVVDKRWTLNAIRREYQVSAAFFADETIARVLAKDFGFSPMSFIRLPAYFYDSRDTREILDYATAHTLLSVNLPPDSRDSVAQPERDRLERFGKGFSSPAILLNRNLVGRILLSISSPAFLGEGPRINRRILYTQALRAQALVRLFQLRTKRLPTAAEYEILFAPASLTPPKGIVYNPDEPALSSAPGLRIDSAFTLRLSPSLAP